MASVQELLLAAQAKQKTSPFSQLAQAITAGTEGYAQGVESRNKAMQFKSAEDLKRAEIAKALIEVQQKQEQIAYQQEESRKLKERQNIQDSMNVTAEQDLRNKQAGIAAPSQPTTPSSKLEETINVDKEGQISKSFKPVTQKQPEVPAGYRMTPDGNMEFIPGGPADPKSRTSKNPPNGFRWTVTGELEAIPGGPADIAAQAKRQTEALASAEQKDKAKLVIGKIDQALSKVSSSSAGAGSILKNVPLTSAKNLDADLTTIKALLGFDQLAQMKNQSRSGASGLGALSDREMNLLVSARANLDQAQDPQQLVDRLNEVKTHYNNWLQIEDGINPYEKNPAAPTNPNPTPATGATPPGKIRVKRLGDNQTGTINESDFDPAKYEKVP